MNTCEHCWHTDFPAHYDYVIAKRCACGDYEVLPTADVPDRTYKTCADNITYQDQHLIGHKVVPIPPTGR